MNMIVPLITALPVSHSVDGEISGESFISRKDAHSFLINVVKSVFSECSKSDMLKYHLEVGLRCDCVDNDTRPWSLMTIE